ncbi:MAG: pore-forming ESAT-6 family protein [Actinomycetota bacterium]
MPSADRISFDTSTSGAVQGDLSGIIGQLESVMSARDAQVSRAMADFQADGVSDQYHHVEQRWHRATAEVRTIIDVLKTTLSRNDETAVAAQSRAATAVQNIG